MKSTRDAGFGVAVPPKTRAKPEKVGTDSCGETAVVRTQAKDDGGACGMIVTDGTNRGM